MNFLFPYMARWKALNWSRYNQIFTRLAEMGHNVHIIQAPKACLNETNFQDISVEMPPNLFVHDVDINELFWNWKLPLNKLVKKGYYSFRCIRTVREIVKNHNIDVLFLYNLPQYPLMKIDSCIKVFDFADDYMAMLSRELGILSNPLFMGLGKYFLDRMVKKSDITLVISKVLANSLDLSNNYKIRLLPNGVQLQGLLPGSGTAIRNQYPKPIIGFIGSFEYFIDFDLILDAAALLTDCTFLLVGTGREFERVREQKEKRQLNNVALTGGVPHDQVHAYIDAMDICLNIFKTIPISHSACPIKLFEYLSMRKPVISTRLDETFNIDRGFLYYADTADELRGAVRHIQSNSEIVKEYTEKGFTAVQKRYDWNKIVDDLLMQIITL